MVGEVLTTKSEARLRARTGLGKHTQSQSSGGTVRWREPSSCAFLAASPTRVQPRVGCYSRVAMPLLLSWCVALDGSPVTKEPLRFHIPTAYQAGGR